MRPHHRAQLAAANVLEGRLQAANSPRIQHRGLRLITERRRLVVGWSPMSRPSSRIRPTSSGTSTSWAGDQLAKRELDQHWAVHGRCGARRSAGPPPSSRTGPTSSTGGWRAVSEEWSAAGAVGVGAHVRWVTIGQPADKCPHGDGLGVVDSMAKARSSQASSACGEARAGANRAGSAWQARRAVAPVTSRPASEMASAQASHAARIRSPAPSTLEGDVAQSRAGQ